MGGVHATSSAVELTAALRSKEISARELLDLYLERIDRLDRDGVNAVVTLDVDRARAAASAADEALARGDAVGPLHGLPITIKDAIETEGIRSTGGAVELATHIPTADAPAVARMKAAGAIVFGKTNLPRWCGDSQAFNELFGTTNNPWSFAHVPGGSSGGSAAALAAGFTGAELGTDIGGSVRAPAHCCGVYALKPSYGVIPNLGYLDHVGGGTTHTDINVFGPMARSAADLELLWSSARGSEPRRRGRVADRATAEHGHLAERAPDRDVVRRRRVPSRRGVPRNVGRGRRRARRRGRARCGRASPNRRSARRWICTRD